MIVTYERDGTMVPNPSGAPTAWLPDGTGYRVVFRFIQEGEGLIAYNGLPATQPNYTAVSTHYATYNAIIVDPALATNNDVDVACVVTGSQLRNGKSGSFTEVEAASCTLNILDEVGMFDPRLEDSPLGPGRRVRTGTWVQVSVHTMATGWLPMFTGLVTSWARTMQAGRAATLDASMPMTDVTVNATDFFAGLGNANFDGAVVQQLTGARVSMLSDTYWSPLWGVHSIAAGTITLDARTLDNAGVLEQMKAAAAVEDGRVYVARDGTLTWETGEWRAGRTTRCTVLGIGATDFVRGEATCEYQRIAGFYASYDAVKTAYLIYDDLKTCTITGTAPPELPRVCASHMTADDSGDDVVNEVTLTYTAPQPPTGYTATTGEAVVASGPTAYTARDELSIEVYGLQSVERGDLTPTTHASTLPNLATTLVGRWRGGNATIGGITIDLGAEPNNHAVLFGLWAGDLINVVDRKPPLGDSPDAFMLTVAEIAGMAWNFTPSRFDLALNLDTHY